MVNGTEPCGTTWEISKSSELNPLIETYCLLPFKYDSNQL